MTTTKQPLRTCPRCKRRDAERGRVASRPNSL